MKFQVNLLAFRDGDVRTVEVPDEEILNRIYRYGQNEVSPEPMPSVSVGDVIVMDCRFFVVRPVGFRELSPEDYVKYVDLPRRDRAWSQYVRPEPELNEDEE